MPEFIKALFANATERIKNPLIGTFFMSWIVFNWKAILFLVISTNDIESRFATLTANYSNNWNLLYFPLIVTAIYIFGLPWLNLWIDDLLSYSNNKQSKRVQAKELKAIYLKTDIAIANIDLENKQKDYRELKSHNETIEGLNNKIKELQDELSIDKKNYANDSSRMKTIIDKLKSTILNYDIQIEKMLILNNSMLVYPVNKDGIENGNNEVIDNFHDNAINLQKIIDETRKYKDVIDETNKDSVLNIPREFTDSIT